ncbi:major facilitator superfamily domain-containing protein [Mycena rosella]|uniref:Major facilitator superfamily domain-containing protein n=1 Tax=Mycena rosella TaxID=1033263 RepID=A0AAD7DD37_MYCRO|nr:major facilitator superfamily domain-containing protein [Mycena rosella]
MAEQITEKGYDSSDDGSGTSPEIFERPTGLKGLYSHPTTQVAMLGFVCFMCPGLFNALSGIGGGGQVDLTTGANANVALYSTFSVMAFFAGSVNNKIGARLTLQLGSLGYALYTASDALNIHPGAKAFVIAAGAILGICAGLLWTAQGSLMLAYPTEGEKARYIAIFWAIFNLGGVLGSAIAFGTNIHTTASHFQNGTYIGFLVLSLIGTLIPMFMVDPKNMIRTDGTKLPIVRNPSWKVEILGLYVALKTDPMIILLFPMFLASNWFYTWQFNEFNGALFNIRTRALNSMLYWSSQIVGSLIMAVVLDMKNVRRRIRAFTGWGIVFSMVFIVHGWGYTYQKEYTRASIDLIAPEDKMDFSDKGFVGRVWLYIFFGVLDAMWQTSVYWMMGAMSNDPSKLAHFTGFYKSIQSAGAAGSWRADAILTPYMNMFASTWALSAAGLLFALPMIYLRVKDHTVLEDETL